MHTRSCLVKIGLLKTFVDCQTARTKQQNSLAMIVKIWLFRYNTALYSQIDFLILKFGSYSYCNYFVFAGAGFVLNLFANFERK